VVNSPQKEVVDMEDVFLSQKVNIFKALAHPVRLEIVERLMEGERCVCEIAAWFSFDRTTISKHLAILRSCGVIRDRKEGLNVYYSLRMICLNSLLSCLEGTLRQDLQNQMEALRENEENQYAAKNDNFQKDLLKGAVNMKIQILGTGCPKCAKLAELADNTARELGLEYELEKVTDINEIMEFGVMATPGLAVNGKVLSAGKIPSPERMKELLQASQ